MDHTLPGQGQQKVGLVGYVHQLRNPIYWRTFQRGLLLNDTPLQTTLHQGLPDRIVWGSLEPKQALLATCAQFPHHHFPEFCKYHGTRVMEETNPRMV